VSNSNLSVAVDVGLLDHGGDLFAGQRLTEVHHDDGQLLTIDEPVAVLIKKVNINFLRPEEKIISVLGLIHTRHFDAQYFDKKILR